MATRHASPDAPLKPWRYASAPEYVEGRGIPGNLVSMKAHLLGNRSQASLQFFLQAMSIKEGGLPQFAKEFLDTYPERMPCYTQEVENFTNNGRRTYWEKCDPRPKIESHLPDLITSLCTNPVVGFELARTRPGDWREFKQFCDHFNDPLGALFDYQQRYAARVRESFTHTSISARLWAALDDWLATGQQPAREKGPVCLIQGESGVGKTWAAQAWSEQHLGEARFVTLSGCMNRTSLFRALSRVYGLPSTYAVPVTQMQGRLEDFLARCRMGVVIDEAHFLLPQYERGRGRPELLDWIDTALVNNGVPVALVTTPQFSARVARIVERSGWNVAQFQNRVHRVVELPPVPTPEDVLTIAVRRLAGAPAAAKVAADYAALTKAPLPSLDFLLEEVERLARRAGRQVPTLADVEAAWKGSTMPTAVLKEKLSTPPPEPKRNGGRRAVPARAKRAPSAEQFLDQSEAPDNGPPAHRRITPAEPALAV